MKLFVLKMMTAAKVLGPYLLKLIEAKRGGSPSVNWVRASVMDATDPKTWAKALSTALAEDPSRASDEGALTTWFSNAIIAGYDAGRTYNRARTFETDGASIPAKAMLPRDNMCTLCKKCFGSCEAKGVVYGSEVPTMSQGPQDDRVLACESFEAKGAG